MGKEYERITPRLWEFIENQKIFFVASAPLTGDGAAQAVDADDRLGPGAGRQHRDRPEAARAQRFGGAVQDSIQ